MSGSHLDSIKVIGTNGYGEKRIFLDSTCVMCIHSDHVAYLADEKNTIVRVI
jgi:hypothetical protein